MSGMRRLMPCLQFGAPGHVSHLRARLPPSSLLADLKNAVTLQQPDRRPAHLQARRKLRAQPSPPSKAPAAPPPTLKKGPPAPIPAAPIPAAPKTSPPAAKKPGGGTASEMPSAAINDALLPQMRNMVLASATAAWSSARHSASMTKTTTCVIDTGHRRQH